MTLRVNELRSNLKAFSLIAQYIVGYYSQHRPHQHNGSLPPNKAEAKYNLVSCTVASFT